MFAKQFITSENFEINVLLSYLRSRMFSILGEVCRFDLVAPNSLIRMSQSLI